MTKSKHTKRALLASALSVLMCLAMLVGSTFAWFTDTALTGVNTIQAGTLNVALEEWDGKDWVSAEGEPLSFLKPDGIDEEVLWEPGVKYQLPDLRVCNEGNLALKFKLIVSGIVGQTGADLAEVLDVYVSVDGQPEYMAGTLRELMNDPDGAAYGNLAANEASEAYSISMIMRNDTGNAYQGATLDGITLLVLATQDAVEYDSFVNTYDYLAEYAQSPTDTAGLNFALSQGGNIVLPAQNNTVTLGNNNSVGGDTAIDMSGSTQPIQSSLKVEDGNSLTMSNGTLEKNGALGSIRFDNVLGGSDPQEGLFEGITFKNNNSFSDMVQIVPRGDSTGTYTFRNCTFINANVSINGLSGSEYGDDGVVNVIFENCTFVIQGWPAINFSSNYCTGSLTIKDCTFEMTPPSGFAVAVLADGTKALSLKFEGANEIINHRADAIWVLQPGARASVEGMDTITTTGSVTLP